MTRQLVLGAGPIGTHLVHALVSRGDEVLVGTRTGTTVEGASAVQVNAADPVGLTRAATGRATIFVCTNPPYHRWVAQWPPIVDAVIGAAEASGAGVVMVGNLYPFGRPTGPMSATTPEAPTETKGRVRAELWRRLKEANDAGRIRAAEVRASDYFGPGAGPSSHVGARFFEPLLNGKTAWTVGNPDVPHAWAYLPDLAETLAVVAHRDDAWGRLWIAPHSGTDTLNGLAALITGGDGHVRQYPGWLLNALGVFSPIMREVAKVRYQHTLPYLVDDSQTRELLGVTSTPLDKAVAITAASYRSHPAAHR